MAVCVSLCTSRVLANPLLYLCRRLSDIDQDNALSQHEFCIAMKLVLMRRKGFEIPSTLPQKLLTTRKEKSGKCVDMTVSWYIMW